MQSSAAEHVEGGARNPGRISKVGLIIAVVLGALAVAMARDMGEMALWIYGPPALALGIRSLFPGMTAGRGVLSAIGGMCAGMGLVVLSEGSDNAGPALIQFLFAFALLWSGFKRGKIQWRKEAPKSKESANTDPD